MSDDRSPDTGAIDASGSDTGATDADGYDRDHAGDDVRAATDRERTTDAVDRTDRETTASAARGETRTDEPTPEHREGATSDSAATTGPGDGNEGGDGDDGDGGGRSDRIAFWASALFGLALAVGAVALVTRSAPFFENVLRVRPTLEGGGVGADWIVGNTRPILEAAITIVHFADVVLGIFILLMVFIHWAAFRRLGARMRPPAGSARARESATATDGGEVSVAKRTPEDGESSGSERSPGPRSSSDRRSDVGEPNAVRRTSESTADDSNAGPNDSSHSSVDSRGGSADDTTAADGGDRQ